MDHMPLAWMDAADTLQQVPQGLRSPLCLVRGVCSIGSFRRGLSF